MQRQIRNLTLAAMLLALGLILPLVTGNIPRVGNLLLPMHLPVFLGGLLLGWQYGLILGAVLPLMCSLLFGMPPLYPVALAMTFELATYGAVAGALYRRSPWKCLRALYRALLLAMFAGRAVWGIAEVALLGMTGKTFTRQMFLAGAFLNAVPGILLQLILIPSIMLALHRTGISGLFGADAGVRAANG